MLLFNGHLEFIFKGMKLLSTIPGMPIRFNHAKREFKNYSKHSNLYAAILKLGLSTILFIDLNGRTFRKNNILAVCIQAFWTVATLISSHVESNIATRSENLVELYNH